jgi:CRISPR-associated protein Csb2
MSDTLLISVRFHDGWYHGSGQTPSPARLFQALVAGAGISGPLTAPTVKALAWLERRSPPVVAVPTTTRGQTVVNFVPNNDLDSKQGDHRRIGEIRTKKQISPLLFDAEIPFLFAWSLEDELANATALEVCNLADRIYQLGRTVDAAWAWGEVLSADVLNDRLIDYPGIVRRPAPGTGHVDCPRPGSLDSIHRRYSEGATQFSLTADGKGQTFRRRAKPKWVKVNYEANSSQLLFEMHNATAGGFSPWPLERVASLVSSLRDLAAEKLRTAYPARTLDIDRVLIGRRPTGENAGPENERVRIIPLPSIGHPQADMQVRRVLIAIPGEFPLRVDDIGWSCSGLQLVHPVSGEAIDVVRASEHSHLEFFGCDRPARVWRSVTPVSLPDATRRRIDPRRTREEAKGGGEKHLEHLAAASAVAMALRHAGIAQSLRSVRVQREPFDPKGDRVESFAEGTRFNKHALWHVELEFDAPHSGPIVIGDGRFLGLGLMRPVSKLQGVYSFSIESGLVTKPDPIRLSRALRRAVMARTGDLIGRATLPAYFTGHQEDGTPGRSEEEPHLSFLFDPINREFLIISPEVLNRRTQYISKDNNAILESALEDFRELRAGKDGHLRVRPAVLDSTTNPLFADSKVWESLTPYQVNRHSRKSTAEAVLINDVLMECERRNLPRPEVTVLNWNVDSKFGLRGNLRLKFISPVSGPVVLGRSRHVGGGIFKRLLELEE